MSSAQSGASELARAVGGKISAASKPIQEISEKIRPHLPDLGSTEMAKNVGRAVDRIEESAADADLYQYGGVSSKATRESLEEAMRANAANRMKENPTAGSSIVHLSSNKSTVSFWERLKGFGPARLFSFARRNDGKHDNVLTFFGQELASTMTERLSSLFAESETAHVIRTIRLQDPEFTIERFVKMARDYIIPEILDALVCGDLATLQNWCSEGSFRVLHATIEPILRQQGHKVYGRIVDIRDVDLISAKMIDERPVLVLSCNVQQIRSVRDAKGIIVEGSDSSIESIQYVFAFGRDDLKNPSGWIIFEVATRDRSSW